MAVHISEQRKLRIGEVLPQKTSLHQSSSCFVAVTASWQSNDSRGQESRGSLGSPELRTGNFWPPQVSYRL